MADIDVGNKAIFQYLQRLARLANNLTVRKGRDENCYVKCQIYQYTIHISTELHIYNTIRSSRFQSSHDSRRCGPLSFLVTIYSRRRPRIRGLRIINKRNHL